VYKNVDDMTDEELCYYLAKAQEYEIVDNMNPLHIVDDSIMEQYGYSTWTIYNPSKYAEQFCTLLDKYKPYISYTTDSVCVEVMSGHHINLYDTKLNYATFKDYDNNVKKALCKAIVALHYGYEFDLEELRDE